MIVDLIVRTTAIALTLSVAITTLLPLSNSHAWWIRGWDFPRAQIAAAAIVALIIALVGLTGTLRAALTAVALACALYQAYRIFPYTPFASTDLELADASQCSEVVTLFAANVLMENEDHAALIREIDAVDPDILLLMETNARWTEAVEDVLARYDTVLREPKDNHYGLIFATRLRADKAKVVYLTDDDTPSVFAELTTKGGQTLRYVGLHPRPPVPGNDTEERDAQILFAARFARDSGVPLVTMGDFNEAAWSDTATLFRSVGEYLDPRRGRGFYASFDARSKLLRCPIDHLYVTEEVAVASFKRGNQFGSDHFPMIAKICLDSDLAKRLNTSPPPLSDDEQKRADEIVNTRRDSLDLALD